MLRMLLHRRAQRAPLTRSIQQELKRSELELQLMSITDRLQEEGLRHVDCSALIDFRARESIKNAMIGTLFMARCQKELSEEEQLSCFILEYRRTAPMEIVITLDLLKIGAEAILEYRRLCQI